MNIDYDQLLAKRPDSSDSIFAWHQDMVRAWAAPRSSWQDPSGGAWEGCSAGPRAPWAGAGLRQKCACATLAAAALGDEVELLAVREVLARPSLRAGVLAAPQVVAGHRDVLARRDGQHQGERLHALCAGQPPGARAPQALPRCDGRRGLSRRAFPPPRGFQARTPHAPERAWHGGEAPRRVRPAAACVRAVGKSREESHALYTKARNPGTLSQRLHGACAAAAEAHACCSLRGKASAPLILTAL